ncbi:MAG: EFR1 family ferrodoxin [Candidatus Hodarchaeota archaeon]
MKTKIYYFTGTGNSLKIARDLAHELGNSELIAIAKVWQMENIESESEKVGFIFPLYYSGLPKIVHDFINSLNISKSNYFFTVVTSTGDINEQPLQQLDKMLQTKSKKLNAGFYIKMPNNYIIGFNVHSKERQDNFFENAIKEVKIISKVVSNKQNNLTQEILEKDVSRSAKVNKNFLESVHESDKSFYADENCNSCGICEKICPVNNIILIDGIPEWQHKCQQCLACINFCPEKSIQFGKETLKTGRYHHPAISVQDIIQQKP